MQTKFIYTNKLLQQQREKESKNQRALIYSSLLLLVFLILSEKNDLPYNRMFSFLCLLIMGYFYRQHDLAAKSILSFDKFLAAAKANNKDDLYDYLHQRGKMAIRARDVRGRNVLHYAVEGNALTAIQFLLEVDENITQAGLTSDIINEQDISGNTPIHNAIKKIIAGQNSYSVLLAMISKKQDILFQGKYIPEDHAPSINPKIHPFLKNNRNETILDLMDQIKDRENPDFKKANLIIRLLCQAKTMSKQEDEGNLQVFKY